MADPRPFTYATACSGIEAPTLAWAPRGWRAAWFSEIAKFPCAVLAHHYPDVPNLGDLCGVRHSEVFQGAALDLLFGGTPCQDFSVAGLRAGLAGARGGLALEFLKLVELARPRWVVWENVPGVLSNRGGRDFGTFLGALAQLGYGFAYRVLDAQGFGVPQQRRRVFVVGHLGGAWQRAAAVLFDGESLRGYPTPRGAARAEVAGTLTSGAGRRGASGTNPEHLIPAIAGSLKASAGRSGPGVDGAAAGQLIPFNLTQITHPENRSNPRPGGPSPAPPANGRPTAIAFATAQDLVACHDLAPTITARHGDPGAVCVDLQNLRLKNEDVAGTLMTTEPSKGGGPALLTRWGVRHFTPRECERLMGFPDDYTLVPYGPRGKPAADRPRYTALGNSIARTQLDWLAERIAMLENLPYQLFVDARGGVAS